MGNAVAVKTMRFAGSASRTNLRDFLKEAAVLSRLKHPNVLNFVGMLNASRVSRLPPPLPGLIFKNAYVYTHIEGG